MKKYWKRIFTISLAFMCLFSSMPMSVMEVKAAEKPQITDAEQLAGYHLLSAEAKEYVKELCQDADYIELNIPNVNSRSANSGNSAQLTVSKTISKNSVGGIIYENKEETLVALVSQPASFSASGQEYNVAASNTVSITWTYTDATLSDLKITFNSMTAKYTYVPSQTTTVTKMDYSVSLQPPYGSYEYFKVGTATNPASGIPYTTPLNSSPMLYGGNTAVALITLYYSNGASSTYQHLL